MKKSILLGGVSGLALMLGASAPALADYGAWAEINAANGVPTENTVIGNSAVDLGQTRNNLIDNSWNPAAGVVVAQQNNGSSNSINAANAIQFNMNGNTGILMGAVVFGSSEDNNSDQYGGTRLNDINNSFNGASGVFTVQQNNGDNNEIGAATSVHSNNGGYGNVDQYAATWGNSSGNDGIAGDGSDLNGDRTNVIDPSFRNFSGVATVQQNNGSSNAIGAATAVAVNVGGVHGADDVTQFVDVVGTVAENDIEDRYGDRLNTMPNDEFDDSAGIVTVQQNNGDGNVMGVATAFSANINVDQNQLQNDVTQGVSVQGSVAGSKSVDVEGNPSNGQRKNEIIDSFDRVDGVYSVQQNNGSNNVMGIGNAVQANIDSSVNNLNGNENVNQYAAASGGSIFNLTVEIGEPQVGLPAHRENLLDNIGNDSAGIMSIQQNNGDGNVMGIANAVAMTLRSEDRHDYVDSTAETDGATFLVFNFDFPGANRDNRIIDQSFDDFDGLLNVQQNNGNGNVMNIANAVTANVHNTGDSSASATNTARGVALVVANLALDGPLSDRVNTINNSFKPVDGIVTVQQNNGDGNVMGSATAVAMSLNNSLSSGFGPATSLAQLSATVTGNVTIDTAPLVSPGRLNTINNSFTGSDGIMVVQQNNGSNNAIQAATSVTANLTGFGSGGGFLSNHSLGNLSSIP